MKKIIALLLCMALMMTVSGCSDDDNTIISSDTSKNINENNKTIITTTSQETIVEVNTQLFFNDFINVNDFEKDFNSAIYNYLTSFDYDGSYEEWKISNLELSDISNDGEYDQLLTCLFGPDSMYGAIAYIRESKIVSIFTFIGTPGISLSDDAKIVYLTEIMTPTSLYIHNCNSYTELMKFAYEILSDGLTSNDEKETVLNRNNITYKISISNNMIGYTIDCTPLWNQKCEELADEYLNYGDYDNAILYYNQANSNEEKFKEAYYQKAVDYLKKGDLESAEKYFNLCTDYKDSDVKLLEVFYYKGENYLKDSEYIEAINSFSLAGNYSDAKEKFKECNFKQGEIYVENSQYHEAIICFSNASDYIGAESKYKQICYLYAEQQLTLGNAEKASEYFMQAGDYKDASTRMNSYYYDTGCEYLNSKQYRQAIDCFVNIIGYSNSEEKYKEANYLYGEELLKDGDTANAKECFYYADDYKDASTRIQRYHYENAEKYLNNKNYLSASDEYYLAETYSDSSTKILECYYQYGVQQMNLNYFNDAIIYLSKCRGYKDTDEILLSHYYSDASKAVNAFFNVFSEESFASDVQIAYSNAKEKLMLCEGYSDSNTLLKIVDKLYYAWDNISIMTNWEASLFGMNVNYSENKAKIMCDKFVSGTSCNLSLSYNAEDDAFEADITNMFNDSARQFDARNVILGLIKLFTSIDDISDLDTALSDKSNWTISGKSESFTMKYGEYNITIKTTSSKNHYIDCKISVSK